MTSQMLANLVERRLNRHEVVDAAADVVHHHQITRPRRGERVARALHELHRLRQRQLQRECQPYHRPAARLIMRLRADGRKQLAVNLRRAVDFRIRAPRAVEVTEEQSAEILPRLHELLDELVRQVLRTLLRDALCLLPSLLYRFLDLDVFPRHDVVDRVLEACPDALQRRLLRLMPAPAIIADELYGCRNHSSIFHQVMPNSSVIAPPFISK